MSKEELKAEEEAYMLYGEIYFDMDQLNMLMEEYPLIESNTDQKNQENTHAEKIKWDKI